MHQEEVSKKGLIRVVNAFDVDVISQSRVFYATRPTAISVVDEDVSF